MIKIKEESLHELQKRKSKRESSRFNFSATHENLHLSFVLRILFEMVIITERYIKKKGFFDFVFLNFSRVKIGEKVKF
jgi:hypothetical protein